MSLPSIASEAAISLYRPEYDRFCRRSGNMPDARLPRAGMRSSTGPRTGSRSIGRWTQAPRSSAAMERFCPSEVWVFPAEALRRCPRKSRGKPMAVGDIAKHLRDDLREAKVELARVYEQTEHRLRFWLTTCGCVRHASPGEGRVRRLVASEDGSQVLADDRQVHAAGRTIQELGHRLISDNYFCRLDDNYFCRFLGRPDGSRETAKSRTSGSGSGASGGGWSPTSRSGC